MSDVLDQKTAIIREAATINELLLELHKRLSKLPRTRVACRQLMLISTKLELWQKAFQPGVPVSDATPDMQEILRVLKIYNKGGRKALTAREQFVLDWLDKNTLKAA